MTIRKLLSQPLLVQAIGVQASTNLYGGEVDGPISDPFPVLGYLEQVTSNEFLVDRDTTVSTWQAFLPAGTSITHNDQIIFQNQRFEVQGEPMFAFNPRAKSVSHIVCKLVVVNG